MFFHQCKSHFFLFFWGDDENGSSTYSGFVTKSFTCTIIFWFDGVTSFEFCIGTIFAFFSFMKFVVTYSAVFKLDSAILFIQLCFSFDFFVSMNRLIWIFHFEVNIIKKAYLQAFCDGLRVLKHLETVKVVKSYWKCLPILLFV